MYWNFAAILAGLGFLVAGAQGLVLGASRLALALGIPPLVVGLTIVAFGTSAPELAVSLQSCLQGKTSIVLGDAVGSNIYNVLFILGLSATITPLAVAPQLIRLDVPIMFGCAGALWWTTRDGTLSRQEGTAFLATLAVYMLLVLWLARRERKPVEEAYRGQIDRTIKPDRRFRRHAAYMAVGIGFLCLGSNLLVWGAVAVAQAWNVSETIIGMTVVTIGTTAPELSACLVAAVRGERDIAVGNIVGSNIFNILAVLGLGAIVAPQGIEVNSQMRDFGIPVMAVVCFSCLPVFFAGRAIRRWEGLLFLVYFAIYLAYLVLEEMRDVRILTLKNAVLWFVGPLTVLTLIVSVYREFRSPIKEPESPSSGTTP